MEASDSDCCGILRGAEISNMRITKAAHWYFRRPAWCSSSTAFLNRFCTKAANKQDHQKRVRGRSKRTHDAVEAALAGADPHVIARAEAIFQMLNRAWQHLMSGNALKAKQSTPRQVSFPPTMIPTRLQSASHSSILRSPRLSTRQLPTRVTHACVVRMTQRPSVTFVMRPHMKRRLTASMPVLGSSCAEFKSFTSSSQTANSKHRAFTRKMTDGSPTMATPSESLRLLPPE